MDQVHPVLPGMAGLLPPPEACNYAQLYTAQAPVTYPNGYSQYMAHFAPDSEFMGPALLTRVTGNTTLPQGFLQICTPTDGRPHVSVSTTLPIIFRTSMALLLNGMTHILLH